MKTKCEILEETKDYYTNHSRAIADGFCIFHGKNDDDITVMCAVGRCLQDPEAFEDRWSGRGVEPAMQLNEQLKPEYRGHGDTFWARLQCFHDTERYWHSDRRGLTDAGLIAFNHLMEIFWGEDKSSDPHATRSA